MKKNNIISCPTPNQVESEDILNIQEKAQAYFDATIVPILKNAVHSPQQIGGHLRYAAYVEAALKSSGWVIRWDNTLRSDVIERKTFKLKPFKWPELNKCSARTPLCGLGLIYLWNLLALVHLVCITPTASWEAVVMVISIFGLIAFFGMILFIKD